MPELEDTHVPYLKVVKFEPPPNPYKEDAVETLEGVFEQAKTGDITGVAIAYVRVTGGINAVHSYCDSLGAMLGALELAKYRILMAVEERHDTDDPDPEDDPDGGGEPTVMPVPKDDTVEVIGRAA